MHCLFYFLVNNEIEKINLENVLSGNIIPDNFNMDIQNMNSSSKRNDK